MNKRPTVGGLGTADGQVVAKPTLPTSFFRQQEFVDHQGIGNGRFEESQSVLN